MHETLVVVDFGSQVTQLISRRIRELGVYAEIVPCTKASARIEALASTRQLKGIVLSGGPSSIYDDGAPRMPDGVLTAGVPVLGICYGLYVLVDTLGGKVAKADEREYGAATIRVHESFGPTSPFPVESDEPVWMSHGDRVHALPKGFRTVAGSKNCEHAAIVDPERRVWGVQFHPEVSHTPQGSAILSAFLELCGFARD